MADNGQQSIATSRCYLLELPPELRLHIYDFYFGETKTCYIKWTPDSKICAWPRSRKPGESKQGQGCALIRTCKVISEETRGIPENRTALSITFCATHFRMMPIFVSIGTSVNLRSKRVLRFVADIKKVTMSLASYRDEDWSGVLSGFFTFLGVMRTSGDTKDLTLRLPLKDPSASFAVQDWFEEGLEKLRTERGWA